MWYNFGIPTIVAYFIGLFAVSLLLLSPFPFIIGIGIPLVFSLYIVRASDKWANTLKNQQFPENLDIRQINHDAFIIVHSMGSFSIGSYAGLDILIPHFIHQRFPFKIYHCYNPQEVLEVLRNDKTKFIWIIGHGWRGGITFKWMRFFWEGLFHKPKKTQFPYAKIRDTLSKYPKKSFIVQFHCNHIEKKFTHNESLVEILLEDSTESEYYITESLTHVISIWFASRELVSRIRRISISESDVQPDPEIDYSCSC
jgi:hypothetical protein